MVFVGGKGVRDEDLYVFEGLMINYGLALRKLWMC
jgi:hypothetical protein